MIGRLVATTIAVSAFAALLSSAATPIPIMILDGESGGPYHDWRQVTPVLKKMLDETGLFKTTVVTAPATTDFSTFAPAWAEFGAVVMNYDAPDERWPSALKASFEKYVGDGGGVVAVHAADNAFPGWAAYNEMIGVGGWGTPGRNKDASRCAPGEGCPAAGWHRDDALTQHR
jgi:hypothetical protein